MALKKVDYYAGQGPAVPAPGEDYSAPDPHDADVSHQGFVAPSSGEAAANASDGLTTHHLATPRVTKPGAGAGKLPPCTLPDPRP
ncbi:MAG: hypothetical protein P4L86_21835 [Mycobacterium sp.]|nr:hypothetical protein [Mycobacterium sp.]